MKLLRNLEWKVDFSYIINHSYSREYSCKDKGCDEEGICRCSKIINFEATGIEMSRLPEFVYRNFVGDISHADERDLKLNKLLWGGTIDMYSIDRIARKMKLYDIDLYVPDIKWGYYGQDFDGIYLPDNLDEEFKQHCYLILSSEQVSHKIDYVLNLEYGVVGEYDNYELLSINISDVDFSGVNQKHINQIHSIGRLDYYSPENYTLPRGIVKRIGNKYRIVDGYHRIINSSLFGEDDFNVIVCK